MKRTRGFQLALSCSWQFLRGSPRALSGGAAAARARYASNARFQIPGGTFFARVLKKILFFPHRFHAVIRPFVLDLLDIRARSLHYSLHAATPG